MKNGEWGIDVPGADFEPIDYDLARFEEAMRRVCTTCERTLREHTPQEYLECVERAVSRGEEPIR